MADLAKKATGGLALLTVTEAANKLDSGKITSQALVRDCLARIKTREPEISAWAYIDSDYAMEQARARDEEPRRSALH